MRHCSKCNRNKPLSEFYRRKTGRGKGQYYEKCKECMKIRGIKYYHQNHERQLALALIRKKKSYDKKRTVINSYKDVPCADCGKKFPFYVMDFDHRDRTTKIADVSHSMSLPLVKIISEIKKCDVVCANCHRIRTYSKIANNKPAEVAKVVSAGP